MNPRIVPGPIAQDWTGADRFRPWLCPMNVRDCQLRVMQLRLWPMSDVTRTQQGIKALSEQSKL